MVITKTFELWIFHQFKGFQCHQIVKKDVKYIFKPLGFSLLCSKSEEGPTSDKNNYNWWTYSDKPSNNKQGTLAFKKIIMLEELHNFLVKSFDIVLMKFSIVQMFCHI